MASPKKVSITVALNDQLSKSAERAADRLSKIAQKQASKEDKLRASALAREQRDNAKREAWASRLAQKEAQMQIRAFAQKERAAIRSAEKIAKEQARIQARGISEQNRAWSRAIREQERSRIRAIREAERERRRIERDQRQQRKDSTQNAANLTIVGEGAGRTARRGVQIGKEAVNTFMGFEEAINDARIRANLKETDQAFIDLRNKAREVGATTQFTATDAARAFERMTASGKSAAEAISLIGDVSNLAALEGITLEEAYNSLGESLAGFGKNAPSATEAIDILSAASDASRASLRDLSSGLVETGSVADSFGVSFKDTVAIMAAFSESGLGATEGGVAGRNFISRIGAVKSKPALEAMKSLGIDPNKVDLGNISNFAKMFDEALTKRFGSGDTERSRRDRGVALKQIFDERGAADFLTFLNVVRSGKFDEIRAKEDAGTGGAAQRAREREKTTAAAVRELDSAFEELQITMVEGLGPALKDTIKVITGIANALGSSLKENPGVAKTVGVGGTVGVLGLLGIAGYAKTKAAVEFIKGTTGAGGAVAGAAGVSGVSSPLSRLGGAGKFMGALGKAAPFFGALIEGGVEYANSGNIGRAGSSAGGTLAGGLVGAKGGALLGSVLGPIGALVGGVGGGIAGSIFGSDLGKGIYDSFAGGGDQMYAANGESPGAPAPLQGSIDMKVEIDSNGLAQVTKVTTTGAGEMINLNTGGALPTI